MIKAIFSSILYIVLIAMIILSVLGTSTLLYLMEYNLI